MLKRKVFIRNAFFRKESDGGETARGSSTIELYISEEPYG
jgi:hypothetical protein